MNLVMCCALVGENFQSDLRFPLIASMFFKQLYPEGQVFVATTPEAQIPQNYKNYFHVIRFDFEKNPFGLSRQMFYSCFCRSEYMTDDTIFSGTDVVISKTFPVLIPHKMLMTYRYHPSQPYCADFVMVRKEHGDFAGEFFHDLVKIMAFLPASTRDGVADQISMSIQVGKLLDEQFDGESHVSPRYKDILLLPGDLYFHTPNDGFSSIKSKHTGKPFSDVETTDQLVSLLDTKYAIHFKGKRKPWFFVLAYMASQLGLINPYRYGLEMPVEELFKGAFDERIAA